MIDVENLIFNAAYDDVAPLCAVNGYRSVSVPKPTVFPTVTLFEIDNRTEQGTRSTQAEEDFSILTYEAHIYALTKAECRKVFDALDRKLSLLNMTRLSGSFSPNNANTEVKEIVARYRVKADPNGILYRVR